MPRSIGLPESPTFRELLDRLPVAAYCCDADGLITYCNAHAVALWGRGPRLRDAEDRFCGSFRLYHPDGTPIRHDGCWMARALREGRSFVDREFVIEREDGTRRTVLAHANPFGDASGRVIGAINVLMDITERKAFEIQLVEATGALEAADRAKTDFLANISHELRTPLNAILGFAEALQQGHFGPMSDRQVEYIGYIATAGKLLHDLVNDILDVSRIEAGGLALNEETIDLRGIVDAGIELLRSRAAEKRIDIATRLPPLPVQVVADPVRMEQVVVNLLGNAVKFSDPGSRVLVHMSVEPDPQGGVRLDIQDCGRGMDADEIELALQPFRRIRPSMQRDQEGAGLGLPLALRLIRLHGGRLDIDSEPGLGTTMQIRLPPDRCLPLRRSA